MTDQEKALQNALDLVFPDPAKLLCTGHLLRNFKTNVRKFFATKEDYMKAEKAFRTMCDCARRDRYDEAHKTYKDAIAKCNDKGKKAEEFLQR